MLPFGFSAVADTEDSELLALRALGFLTSARSGISRLAQTSGLRDADFARRPLRREHLAAVLDFIITDEALLVAFARAVEVSPETLYEARRLLRLGPIAAEGFVPTASRPDRRAAAGIARR
jgi:hypothetical protein